MFVSLSIIVNSFFLIGAPHVEYEMGDFKKFGVRKVWRVRTETRVATYRWRAKAFGIYAGYEWHPGLKRGPERGVCYGPEGITVTGDCVYFRKGSFHCSMSNRNQPQLSFLMRTGHQAAVQQPEPYLENEVPQSVDR